MSDREEVEAITLAEGKGFALFDGSIEGSVTTNRQNIVLSKGTHLKLPIYAARILLQSNHIAVFLPKIFRPSSSDSSESLMVDPPLINMKRLGFRAFYAIARFFYALLKHKPKLCLVIETKQYSPQLPERKTEALDYLNKNPTLTSEVAVSVAREALDALRMKLSSEEEMLLDHALLESKRQESYFRKMKQNNQFYTACSEEIEKEAQENERRTHYKQETEEQLPL